MRSVVPALLIVGIGALAPAAAGAQQYVVTDLGTLGGDMSQAAAINSLGQIAGTSTVSGSSDFHPFLWTDGVMQDLGLLPNYTVCYARGVNDSATVVGYCQRSTAATQGFIWTPAQGLQPLNAPDGAVPLGINNDGTIVGIYNAPQSSSFVLRNGTFSILDSFSTARAVNDNGQIVGDSLSISRAVMWDASGEHDLGTLDGANTSQAFAVRSDGLAVGNASFFGSTVATYFSQYGVGNLGTLGGPAAQANGISGNLVVGGSRPAEGDGHAFLYDFTVGTMVDLNTTIPVDAGWTLDGAIGVNASGWIIGAGHISGLSHGFLLRPAGPPGGGNLLLKPGFEEYTPPALGAPGWVSDISRQVPAKSETNQPHSGSQNAACWATENLDCGMFQDVKAPASGTYTLTFFANADRPGALVGANVNNNSAASAQIDVRGFANYGAAYTLTFSANRGDTIRVWMYSPATPGYLVMDDVVLAPPQ